MKPFVIISALLISLFFAIPAGLTQSQGTSSKWDEYTRIKNTLNQLSKEGRYQEMLPGATRMLELAKGFHEDKWLAESYHLVGFANFNKGNDSEAIENFTNAIAIFEDLYINTKDQVIALQLADVYNRIGGVFVTTGNRLNAIENFQKSIALQEKLFEKNPSVATNLATSYRNMGLTYIKVNIRSQAIKYFEMAIKLHEELFNKDPNPQTANSLAESFSARGSCYIEDNDLTQAIKYLEKAIKLQEEYIKQDSSIAVYLAESYSAIGSVYFKSGKQAQGFEYLKNSLKLREEVYKNRPNHITSSALALSYYNLGMFFCRIKNYIQGVEYLEKAKIYNTTFDDNKTYLWGLSSSLLLSGKTFTARKELDEGIPKLDSLNSGSIFSISGLNTDAGWLALNRYHVKANALLSDTVGAFNASERSRSRSFLNELALKTALFVSGIDPADRARMLTLHYETSNLYSQVIQNMKISNESLSIKIEYLHGLIQKKIIEMMKIEENLNKNKEYNKKKKPRIADISDAKKLCGTNKALLDYVIWEGDDPLRQSYCIIITPKGEKIVTLEKDFPYTEHIERFHTLISNQNQSINFVLGKNNSGKTKLFPVETREPISNCIPGKDCADRMDGTPPVTLFENDGRIYNAVWKKAENRRYILDKKEDSGFYNIRIIYNKDRLEEIDKLSALLYKELIAPAEAALKDLKYDKDAKELIIIPDGPLALLPFDALKQKGSEKYLFEKYNITLTPSVSVLKAVTKRKIDYSKEKRDDLIAFVGPEYGAQNPERSIVAGSKYRLASNTKSFLPVAVANEIELNGPFSEGSILKYYKGRGINFENLFLADEENSSLESIFRITNSVLRFFENIIDRVIAFFNNDNDYRFVFSGVRLIKGKEASEEKVKELSEKGTLEKYKVVHFSTHGFFATDYPPFTSLILSETSNKNENEKKEENLKKDEKLKKHDDGYLTVGEAAILRLKADLVTLSACETGFGDKTEGEGFIGFIRAFHVAGANAVSATLWKVDETATLLITENVYKAVRDKKIGYKEAYAMAKKDLLNKEKYKDPYYWSSFSVYGE